MARKIDLTDPESWDEDDLRYLIDRNKVPKEFQDKITPELLAHLGIGHPGWQQMPANTGDVAGVDGNWELASNREASDLPAPSTPTLREIREAQNKQFEESNNSRAARPEDLVGMTNDDGRYSDMSVAELREEAGQRNVELESGMRKADIIAALQLADESSNV